MQRETMSRSLNFLIFVASYCPSVFFAHYTPPEVISCSEINSTYGHCVTSEVRCGPPLSVHFNRHSGQLDIQVFWGKEEKVIDSYSLRYKELNRSSWVESPVKSHNRSTLILGNLNSSMTYEVQLQVLANQKCTQCPWSKIFLVQPELTEKPIIQKVKDTPKPKGMRLVIIKWKFAASELSEGYSVTVWRSGETTTQTFKTRSPKLRLTLSHSSYHLEIKAVSRVGTSPAALWTIHSRYDKDLNGKLNVTFNGNMSFTVSWVNGLIQNYSCFSVEWAGSKGKAAHKSFYQDEHNNKVIDVDEPLQLYRRYIFTLHTRPDKDTCNLKSINNSESTYGNIQAYFKEGTPLSAPGNISSNVTHSSIVLEWSSVPEEDIRGFLLGYVLYYRETPLGGTDTETNVTIDAASTSYELVDLNSSTLYQVQLSAFTGAGMGVRSSPAYFETKPKASLFVSGVVAGVVTGVPVLFLLAHLCSKLFERAKKLLWPSIPNPDNSNAIQRLDAVYELKLLDPMNRQKWEEEEGDSRSLRIIDRKEEMSSMSNVYGDSDLCLHVNTDQDETQGSATSTTDSAKSSSIDLQTSMSVCQTDTATATATESKAPRSTSDTLSHTSTDMNQTVSVSNNTVAHECPPLAFLSDYTTMEHFQQTVLQSVPGTSSSLTPGPDSTLTTTRFQYICLSNPDPNIPFSSSGTQNVEVDYTVL
ncbi:hypothetical protein DPEC_G00324210 [Dallia pectoralis]|uniref:Uncharacterized protein n=1 Tax=Dallia pectoralis TaxID=75939 RepID=A0ACC2FAZ0_DALPE|nr:hypothetical protein DPEC_G00324210 [Dallia pectoralis]